MNAERHVIVMGGGFAGLGCVCELARHHHARVTLIDRNNYPSLIDRGALDFVVIAAARPASRWPARSAT